MGTVPPERADAPAMSRSRANGLLVRVLMWRAASVLGDSGA
jgi:hypothetical protein